MYQVISVANVLNPFEEIYGKVDVSNELRGQNSEILVTGEFASAIRKGTILPLSVNEVSNQICPTGRDVYISKGLNRPKSRKIRNGSPSFERTAGMIGEKFFVEFLMDQIKTKTSYKELKDESDRYFVTFLKSKKKKLDELKNESSRDYNIFLSQLKSSGRIEATVSNFLSEFTDKKITKDNIKFHTSLNPNSLTGISKDSKPDFLVPNLKLVGDIKSGEALRDSDLLICTGYAIAYENAIKTNIDWGMIYFFKAKNQVKYGRYVSLPQVYIFPIDDSLRNWFIQRRNQALDIAKKGNCPPFPSKENTKKCHHCRFKSFCEGEGLVIE